MDSSPRHSSGDRGANRSGDGYRDSREHDGEAGAAPFGGGQRREARGARHVQSLAAERLGAKDLRLARAGERLELGSRDGEKRGERAARELVVAQPEEALGGGIAHDDGPRGVALELRQRRALEEGLEALGAIAGALRGRAAHGDAMRELLVLALQLLVEHRGEREQVVALDLQPERLLELAVELAGVEHDREAEEERHGAREGVRAALEEEDVEGARNRGRDGGRLVRAAQR